MSTARKTQPVGESEGLGQRAKASRASASRFVRADAEAPPDPTFAAICPASQLGEMLEKAWILRDECEEQSTLETHSALSGLTDYAMRQIDNLEMGISFVRASSPAGMLTQLAVATNALDLVLNGSTPAICEAASEQLERCLYSVAAALCAGTGIEREGFVANLYMPVRLDKLASISPGAAQ